MDNSKNCSVENIFNLDGRVPLLSAIPFGVQHILAMFVANITPIFIVAGAAGLSKEIVAILLQNAMFIAGIATIIQLYALGPIGSRLPIVMGVSFTFVPAACYLSVTYGYGSMVGAVIVGGFFEGVLGLLAKYWRRLVPPLVSSLVVLTIGYSLLGVGVRSFGGGYAKDFGSFDNLFIGTITLTVCLLYSHFATGYRKQLAVLVGLFVGYIVAFFFGKVQLDLFRNGIIAFPNLLPFTPEFNINAIISVAVIYIVSAAETIGDTSAVAMTGLDREVTEKEIRGSIACDGFFSSLSGVFGCTPITSFSQNVGLVAMTKVVNRFSIMTGAVIMILAGLFPPIAVFISSLPDAVLGGCTIMMFGSILVSGIKMIVDNVKDSRGATIAAIALAFGIGSTLPSEAAIWKVFPKIVQDIFSGNCVAVVFVVAVFLNLVLPYDRR